METGADVVTIVSKDRWGDMICLKQYQHPIEAQFVEGVNMTMLMKKAM